MIPAGASLDVDQETATLDAEFGRAYPSIKSASSALTTEAVKQLKKISELPEQKLRSKLIRFATEREAIPAAAYADHLVKRIAEEPDPFGRIYSFALRNAWQDEALHTQFLLECCVPGGSGAKWAGKFAGMRGHAMGTWTAHIFHDPGPVALLLHKMMVQFAVRLPNAPVSAILSVEPMTTSEYFAATVNFEYAAALGWRVIAAAELPRREIPDGTAEKHRVAWRAEVAEPGELARISRKIASTEIRHAKMFWQLGTVSDHRLLIAALRGINVAFLAPEFRVPPVTKAPFTLQMSSPADDPLRLIEDLLRDARNGIGRGSGHVTLAFGDCSLATAEMVAGCIGGSSRSHHRTIGAPNGLGLSAVDHDASRVYEFEAGCARAKWPSAWVDAQTRISIAELGGGSQPGLGMGALGRLVKVFPEELRRPLRGTPDPQFYALMRLLEKHPPHLSIIFGGDGEVFYDSKGEPVAFDEAVVRRQGLRRSAGLEEAMRWFGTLIPEVVAQPE